MAVLSKNGSEVARFDLLKKSYSYRSNGKLLINSGFGWKQANVKEGWNFNDSLAQRRQVEEKLKKTRPCFLAYRKAVQDEFPLSVRWEFFTALDMLGDDIDGICSELNDRGHCVDLDSLCEIAELKRASAVEFKNNKEAGITE